MLIIPELFTHKFIVARQSTRIGGVSKPPYASMNLGVFGDDTQALANVELFTQQQQLPHSLVFLKQIHSNRVVEYSTPPTQHGSIAADACFTRNKGIVCAVLSADCLPVLIADANATVVAAVHCGWRGLQAQILTKTLEKLKVTASDLYCWLGPCISYQPYQVDEQFRHTFVSTQPQLSHCFYRNKNGGWHADLKKIAVTQLQDLGVKHITQSPYCTYANKSLFYSYRRDQQTGRMASLIWLQ